MSAIFVALVVVMLIGCTSAIPLSPFLCRDDTGDIIEIERRDGGAEEDPQIIEYFKKASEILQRIRGPPSRETGERVSQYNPETDPWNPEELGSYFEGDILYPEVESDSVSRTGLLATSKRWPGGVIPYTIAGNFDNTSLRYINQAFQHYRRNIPCMMFIKRVSQKNYISITSEETGCWSTVGRKGGMQVLNLQEPGCTRTLGTPVHELMHAAGFFHEQSREDRDDHVTIQYRNIMAGYERNFYKVDSGETTTFSVPYTYSSVMHYSRTAFSKNEQDTIVAKPNANVTMGQRRGFDPNDVKKLRAMYGCPENRGLTSRLGGVWGTNIGKCVKNVVTKE